MCREIPIDPVQTYDTVQQMFVGLGIRNISNGVHLNVDGGLPGRGMDLQVMSPEALTCFDQLVGIVGGQYKGTALHANIRELRSLIDYLKTGGNTGDASVITGEEIDTYVNAFMSTPAGQALHMSAQDYRDLTVGNLSAYLGIVQFVGGGTPFTPRVSASAEPVSTAIRTYGSVQQMYTGLVGPQSGTTVSVRSSVPEDVPEGGIPLGILTVANLAKIRNAIGLGNNGVATTPLQKNAQDILALIDYFKGAGNLEHDDPNIITSAEIDAYVRSYVTQEQAAGNRSITFDGHRAVTVGNIRAFLAVVQHISTPPAPASTPPTQHTRRAPAPEEPLAETPESNNFWLVAGGLLAGAATLLVTGFLVGRWFGRRSERTAEVGTGRGEANFRTLGELAVETQGRLEAAERAARGARGQLGPARVVDLAPREARLAELRESLAAKQREFEAAEARLRTARENLEAKETQLAAEQEALRNIAPDDPLRQAHEDAVMNHQREVTQANHEMEIARGSETQPIPERMRAQISAIEADIRQVEGEIGAISGGRNALGILEAARPPSTPPPLPINPPAAPAATPAAPATPAAGGSPPDFT